MRYGMVMDLGRCVGCSSCVVACRAEHGQPAGILYHRVEKYEVGKYPSAYMRFLPILCMHCQEPPCLEVCPTGATYKRDDGLVLIDHNKCIGCRYCILACPYDVRQSLKALDGYYGPGTVTPFETAKHGSFDTGTAVKCDFCSARLAEGKLPACVDTCPAQARCFGDLDDPESEVSRLVGLHGGTVLKEELGTKPSVYYIRG